MKQLPLRAYRKTLYPILILLLIVLIGFAIRAWRLDTAPKGALIDELHFGYLAYSLLETGADEHGQRWPILFRGFGDQKLPAYAYALLPVVRVLGLTVQALRIPSLLAGSALILGIAWLLKEWQLGWKWSLWGAFITALIPWSFFLSRIGFESNLALCVYTFGLAALVRGGKKYHAGWLLSGGLLLAGTWYSYIAYRPVTVVLLTMVLVVYRVPRKLLASAVLPFVIVCIPLLLPSVIGANSARFNQVGITHDPGLAMEVNEQRTFCSMNLPTIVCYGIFNKPALIAQKLIARTLRTYSPQYLATEGEDETFLTVARYGQLYTSLYPFFAIGLAALLFSNLISIKHRLVIAAGLVVSAVPGLLAGEPQKVRLSPLLPFVVAATSLGTAQFFHFIRVSLRAPLRSVVGTTMLAMLVVLVCYQASTYFTAYFGVHTTQRENEYQSYLPDLYRFISSLPSDSLVVIKPFYSDPLMFYAFYNRIDPTWYQNNAVLGPLEDSGFQHTVELGSIWAYDYSLPTVKCKAESLSKHGYLVTNEQLPFDPIYQGKSTNGVHTYVYIYDSLPAVTDCEGEPTPVSLAK